MTACLQKDVYGNVTSRFFYNSRELDPTQISINERIDKQTVRSSHSGEYYTTVKGHT